ncbi:MAG: hypothetical protein Q7S43_03975 [bacterium]|nr:hypothetical protein [bacterium]
MRTIASFVVGAFIVLAMAIPAEAQYNNRGGYRRPLPGGWGGGGGYNQYYDPSYLQQMMSLPDGLAACTVDLSTTKVTSCHPVIKDVQVVEAHARDHADRGEMLGTIHVEKGRFHFRPFDDTNGRLGTMSAGALGAGAGAMVGYGSTQNMRNRGKANAIGASATIGGGLLAGWMASRHTHNNCLKIEPTVARSISEVVQSPAPLQEQGTSQQPIAGPAANSGEGEFSLENQTRVYVEAYDGETYIGRMEPGAKMMVDPPKDRYRGFALVPTADGRLGKDELDREVSPSGWSFIEPKVAQGR